MIGENGGVLYGGMVVAHLGQGMNPYIDDYPYIGVKKGVNERIIESMLRWFGHVERMNDSRLVKRMYSGECVGNRPAGRPMKKWIESVKECLEAVSYTHLRAHETPEHLVCRLLLEKKKNA